jgi:hypothetical protein
MLKDCNEMKVRKGNGKEVSYEDIKRIMPV